MIFRKNEKIQFLKDSIINAFRKFARGFFSQNEKKGQNEKITKTQ